MLTLDPYGNTFIAAEVVLGFVLNVRPETAETKSFGSVGNWFDVAKTSLQNIATKNTNKFFIFYVLNGE